MGSSPLAKNFQRGSVTHTQPPDQGWHQVSQMSQKCQSQGTPEAISPAPACPDCYQPVWERASPQISADGDSRGSRSTARLTPMCKPSCAPKSLPRSVPRLPWHGERATLLLLGHTHVPGVKGRQSQRGLSQRDPSPARMLRGSTEESCGRRSTSLPHGETAFGVALTSCLAPAQTPALLS